MNAALGSKNAPIVKAPETILVQIAAMRAIFTLAALAACASSGGCAVLAVSAVASAGMVAVQDRSAGQAVDDASDYGDVHMRLMAADSEGFRGVHVQVQDGSLLLSGAVPDEQHRQAAEMIARNHRNLHNVYDELAIGAPESLMRNAADDLIAAQLRARLIASPAVRAVNINIEVFNGNVYLLGTARSDQELHRAAEIASVVSGVHRVVSFMQVIDREGPRTYEADAAPAPAAAPAPGYAEAPVPPPQTQASASY
jgi:osmotically-inducible protein OsmY